jgi:hypothetical protein
MLLDTNRDTVGDQATENLGKAVEAKPDTSACPLLLDCIPLRGEKRKTWCDRSLEYTEKKAYWS